jgi:hypothetical protein
LSSNREKKEQLQLLSETGCRTCPLLDENIKKLEKLLVRMQLQARDLMLDGQNKKDTIHKLRGKTKLPLLSGRPLIN